MRLVGNTPLQWWTTVEADDVITAVRSAKARAHGEQLGVASWSVLWAEPARWAIGGKRRWIVTLIEAVEDDAATVDLGSRKP
jgi:hypothetical protein